MGQLGWLDILALGAFVLTLAGVILRALRASPGVVLQPLPRIWLVSIAAVVAGGLGTLPAALCWEGLPHAFRSMGTWPAVAVFTGASLSAVWSRVRLAGTLPLVPVLALLLAFAQTAYFFPHYFEDYRVKSAGDWDGELRAAARSRDAARFAVEARKYDADQFRYYLLVNFKDTCESSRDHADRILNGGN
jgi:hypothetical protein